MSLCECTTEQRVDWNSRGPASGEVGRVRSPGPVGYDWRLRFVFDMAGSSMNSAEEWHGLLCFFKNHSGSWGEEGLELSSWWIRRGGASAVTWLGGSWCQRQVQMERKGCIYSRLGGRYSGTLLMENLGQTLRLTSQYISFLSSLLI